jgi:hypothetical protein
MGTFLIPPITLPGLFPLVDAFPCIETLGYCRGFHRLSHIANFLCCDIGLISGALGVFCDGLGLD